MTKKRLLKILNKVKENYDVIKCLSNEELGAKTDEFKQRLNKGETLNSLLPEAFAVVCEADNRILGKLPYDVQIMGGIAMHLGYLAEMNTGEGKTLTATMPLYLNALTGKSVMLITANDYLAYRDAEEMRPVYNFLGLSEGTSVQEHIGEEVNLTYAEKKEIYSRDIVYTTHATLGFDYLINNLVASAEDRFLREFYYVIIDEADSVMLDAAQMPLVISGDPRVQSNLYGIADFFVSTLNEEDEYEEEEKAVWLTRKGVKYAESFFRINKYYSEKNFEINRHVTLALRSHVLFENGKDYVVDEKNELMLLDNGTGRLLPGMKLRGGQHQALESKEKLNLSQENRSVASITYQNLLKMFPKFSGMSGTIADAKSELRKVYKKKVAIIPPNKPLKRIDMPDKYYKTAEEQYEAAVSDIINRHGTGQPVLVVSSTIKDTENISKLLVKEGIPHSVLNANNAFWEAQMIANAGLVNSVTVSTGMAGRGTDIKLGTGVKELGGLAVIGIGRMPNVRLERQARGRAGRQGEPGVSQFYVSLEDDIVKSIGEKKLEKMISSKRRISISKLKRTINGSQSRGEENAVEQRKNSIDYDKILQRQREMIYSARNNLLDGVTPARTIIEKLEKDNIKSFVHSPIKPGGKELRRYILDNISYNLDEDILRISSSGRYVMRRELAKYADNLLEDKREIFASDEDFEDYLRLCSLRALDDAWVEQVDYLQQLQYAISGRSTAQRNLVVEYQREAYFSFMRMQKTLKEEIARNVFLSEVEFDQDGKMSIIFP